MILTGEQGRKLTAGAFRHLMIDAYTYLEEHHGLVRGLEKQGVTTHGLRYAAATRLHELGCSLELIASITGHETIEMVKKCIERKRDAKLAIATLDAGTAAQKSNESDKPVLESDKPAFRRSAHIPNLPPITAG